MAAVAPADRDALAAEPEAEATVELLPAETAAPDAEKQALLDPASASLVSSTAEIWLEGANGLTDRNLLGVVDVTLSVGDTQSDLLTSSEVDGPGDGGVASLGECFTGQSAAFLFGWNAPGGQLEKSLTERQQRADHQG